MTVPGTVAEGRPCDSCGTPHRTPGPADIDIDGYSVRHNPDLGDDTLRPDIQEMQRRQEAQNRSQVSLDGRESSFMPSYAVAESEALPLMPASH